MLLPRIVNSALIPGTTYDPSTAMSRSPEHLPGEAPPQKKKISLHSIAFLVVNLLIAASPILRVIWALKGIRSNMETGSEVQSCKFKLHYFSYSDCSLKVFHIP